MVEIPGGWQHGKSVLISKDLVAAARDIPVLGVHLENTLRVDLSGDSTGDAIGDCKRTFAALFSIGHAAFQLLSSEARPKNGP